MNAASTARAWVAVLTLCVVTALAPLGRAHASCGALTCRDLGDSTATCTSTPTGYTCTCTAGFINTGADCVSACTTGAGGTSGTASDPCGHGGTCTPAAGGWMCGCRPGYASTGGTFASCVDYDACTPIAAASCVSSQAGNACVDDAAPATTYHCTCGNAAYTTGTVGGVAACVDRNGCAPNHCLDGGDATAMCVDAVAPMAGYSCTCDAGYLSNGVTCVDDCGAGPDPCGHGGTCTATPGGWTCSCPSGYVSSGGAHGSCVDYDACTAAAAASCASSEAGNACVDEAAPSMTYHCTCANPAYTAGMAGGMAACVDSDGCAPNHCLDGGDAAAMCVDAVAPMAGYGCTCDVGYTSDGVTCVDANECLVNHCVDGGDTGAVCTDHPAPATGYDCACSTGWMPGTVGGAASCVSTPVDAGTDAAVADASTPPDSSTGGDDASTSDAATTTDAAPADDASSTASDASSGGDAAPTADAGAATGLSSGACGCRAASGPAPVAPISLMAVVVLLVASRRRSPARPRRASTAARAPTARRR